MLCVSQGHLSGGARVVLFCPESALRPGISGIFWESRGVADPYPIVWFYESEGKACQPWVPEAGLDVVEA